MSVPPGPGGPIFAPNLLKGTLREPANHIGSFGARLTQDIPVPSGEWTKIPFDEVVWDTAGTFDPRRGAFVAGATRCAFAIGGRIVIPWAAGKVRLDLAVFRNGSPESVREGGPSGSVHERHRAGHRAHGILMHATGLIPASPGDVFEVYVRHDVGAEVFLSGKDPMLADNPQLSEPTANYFMGIYERS